MELDKNLTIEDRIGKCLARGVSCQSRYTKRRPCAVLAWQTHVPELIEA
jgi:hypothetical protein